MLTELIPGDLPQRFVGQSLEAEQGLVGILGAQAEGLRERRLGAESLVPLEAEHLGPQWLSEDSQELPLDDHVAERHLPENRKRLREDLDERPGEPEARDAGGR